MRKLIQSSSVFNLEYSLLRFSIFNTLKRSASTIVMPIVHPDKSLIAEYKDVLNTFRTSRNQYDTLLNKHLMSGKDKMKNNQYIESIKDFDQVIALVSGETLSKLSDEEKEILAEAYAHKAVVLSYGSSADVNLALAHLDRSLELNPNLKIAIECRQGILSEKIMPIESSEFENNIVNFKT